MTARRKKLTAQPRINWKFIRMVVQDIAGEAHMMGRIYANTGEKRGPGDEYERVVAMCDRFLTAARIKGGSRGR